MEWNVVGKERKSKEERNKNKKKREKIPA